MEFKHITLLQARALQPAHPRRGAAMLPRAPLPKPGVRHLRLGIPYNNSYRCGLEITYRRGSEGLPQGVVMDLSSPSGCANQQRTKVLMNLEGKTVRHQKKKRVVVVLGDMLKILSFPPVSVKISLQRSPTVPAADLHQRIKRDFQKLGDHLLKGRCQISP